MTIVEMKPEGLPGTPGQDDPAAPRSHPPLTDAAGHALASSPAAIVAGATDSGGEHIHCVYFKSANYAIYRRGTPPQVVVAYATDPAVAAQQISALSGLLSLRDHVLHLIENLPPARQENYRTQIAEALRLGLEKLPDAAKALLTEAADDALAEQTKIGRLVYLQWTGMALIPALALILFGGSYIPSRVGVHLLLMAAGAGAVGAVLSIAIGIRARTVAIEGDWKSNAVDAAVRVVIGMISAAVLYLLLNSGILTTINAGGVNLTGGAMQWQVALLVGFAAGFLERLVPDLLEKSAPASAPPAPAPAPATGSGAGVATPAGRRS